MSLTRLLKNEDSWLNAWLAEQVNMRGAIALVKSHNDVMARSQRVGVRGGDPMKTGMAFTYAFRYFLKHDSWLQTVAANQSYGVGASQWDAQEGVRKLMHAMLPANCLQTDIPTCVAAGSLLMAELDGIARGRRNSGVAMQLVSQSSDFVTLAEESIVKARETVADIAALYRTLPAVMQTTQYLAPGGTLTLTPSTPFVSNPTFSLGHYLGGADAQLVMDGMLFDIRSSWKSRPMTVSSLYQQIVYFLLDEDDEHGINKFCWYYSRQQAIFEHPLERLVKDPVALRRKFAKMLRDRKESSSLERYDPDEPGAWEERQEREFRELRNRTLFGID